MHRIFNIKDIEQAESYLVAIIEIDDKEYKLNIQGGKSIIKIPRELSSLSNSSKVIVEFDDIKTILDVHNGNDWFEVYDDKLLEELYNKTPLRFIIKTDML